MNYATRWKSYMGVREEGKDVFDVYKKYSHVQMDQSSNKSKMIEVFRAFQGTERERKVRESL